MRCRRLGPARRLVLAVAVFGLVGLWNVPAGRGCTTAVVSGRATADGRPLLWKNRDTSSRNNEVVYRKAKGSKYAYVGVVNAGSTSSVWMGANEAGFCIENSVVKDLKGGSSSGPGNGGFMKHALETCATVADFEALLDRTNGKRKTRSNFGVIDAAGGAAIFETGHQSYVKFDANDPGTAPRGYVVRSNFTMTGTGAARLSRSESLAEIYSGTRFLRAEALFRQAAADGGIGHRWMLRNCCRDFADADGVPYPSSVNGPAGTFPPAIEADETLCRYKTVSAAVFHGVKTGEDPRLTTMWVLLGDPAFSAAVPCWPAAESVSKLLDGPKTSRLCSTAIALRKPCYDGENKKMLRPRRLPEIWKRTWPVEDDIFQRTAEQLARWRSTPPPPADVARFHRRQARRAMETLAELKQEFAPGPVVASRP